MDETDDKKNIFNLIPGQAHKDALHEALRGIKAWMEDLSVLTEWYTMTAKIRKMKYDQLIQEGFNENQAIEIVKGGDLFL